MKIQLLFYGNSDIGQTYMLYVDEFATNSTQKCHIHKNCAGKSQ